MVQSQAPLAGLEGENLHGSPDPQSIRHRE